MIRINKIIVHNFLSFEDEEFEFKNGNYIVLGENKESDIAESNGSGKSSLFFDALVYVIYGKTFRNTLNRYNTNDTYVELHFYYDDSYFIVRRYYNHFKFKNDIIIIRDDEDVIMHTKKEKQQFLNSMFKLSLENFISSICFKQGFDVNLVNMLPSKRKEFFSSVIDEDFDRIEKSVKKDIKLIENDLSVLKEELNKYNNDISYLKGRIKSYIDISSVNVSDDYVLELKSKIDKLENKINEIENELKNLNDERNEEYMKFNKTQLKFKFAVDKLKKLITGVCPLCGNKIKNVEDYKNLLKIYENKMKREFKFEKENEINELKNKLNKYNKMLNGLKEEYINKLSMIDKMKNLSDKINKLKKELSILEEKRDKIDVEYTKKKLEYDKLVNFHNLVKPSGELRTVVIMNYIEVFNDVLKSIMSVIYPEFQNIKLVITEEMKGIEIEGINYKNLSGGEKRRLDIIFQLAFSDFISIVNSFDINIRIVDEIFDNLDDSSLMHLISYIKDLFSDKIFICISHNNSIKSFFDNVIIIEKENGVSRIRR